MTCLHDGWVVNGRYLFRGYPGLEISVVDGWDTCEGYSIIKIVKEEWDELWHAYYWKTDNLDVDGSVFNKLVYVRIPEDIALQLFANLI